MEWKEETKQKKQNKAKKKLNPVSVVLWAKMFSWQDSNISMKLRRRASLSNLKADGLLQQMTTHGGTPVS